MRTLTLDRRLQLGIAALVTALAALTAFCFVALGDSTRGAADVKDDLMPQMMRLADLEVHFTRASLGLRGSERSTTRSTVAAPRDSRCGSSGPWECVTGSSMRSTQSASARTR